MIETCLMLYYMVIVSFRGNYGGRGGMGSKWEVDQGYHHAFLVSRILVSLKCLKDDFVGSF